MRTQRRHCTGLRFESTLAVLASLGLSLGSTLNASEPPKIKKLGTIDCGLVEATPLVIKDRLYRFEYVREDYSGNSSGGPYFRLVDVATGKATSAFEKGLSPRVRLRGRRCCLRVWR